MSLADKLDTLRGCFAIGMVPTGSRDPFALRRAAQGVVKILVEGKLEFTKWRGPMACDETEAAPPGPDPLTSFFEDRIKFYFRDHRGFAYDEVNAAMAAGWSNLPDLEARLIRIQNLRSSPDFEPLAASFKRIRNILDQAGQRLQAGSVDTSAPVDPSLLGFRSRGRLHMPSIDALPVSRSRTPSPSYAPKSISSSTKSWSTRLGPSRPPKPSYTSQHAVAGILLNSRLF